ncbi:MAG: SprT-like domain-containing protein [Archaeoglobaceae archaeon]
MRKEEFLDLTYTSQEIEEKFQEIYGRVLTQSDNLCKGNYTLIAACDLRLLFELYDQKFFDGFFTSNYKDNMRFRLSKRMTRAAGKTQLLKDNGFMIALSTTLVFQTFNDIKREIRVNGLVCKDRLEVTMRVLEHEIVHVIEYILFGTSSCSKPRFKRLASNIFGHTEVTHQLVTQTEIAHKNYNLRLGDNVSFEYGGGTYEGFVDRITKRATVMVKDREGPFIDSKGNRYTKFYVPLHHLRKVD